MDAKARCKIAIGDMYNGTAKIKLNPNKEKPLLDIPKNMDVIIYPGLSVDYKIHDNVIYISPDKVRRMIKEI